MSYYILDPNDGPYAQPKPVNNEDPHNCTKKVDHWEFWLYRRYSTTDGVAGNRWGMIYDKTLDQAQRELEQGQKFEIAYAKFFNKPENSEVNTYFNPYGPIACLGSYADGISDQLEKFMKGMTVGQALFSAIGDIISGKGFSGLSPGLFDSYGNALHDGIQNVKKLSDALMPGLDTNIDKIGDIVGSITNIEQSRQNIIQSIDNNGNDLVSDIDDTVLTDLPNEWRGVGCTAMDKLSTYINSINPDEGTLSITWTVYPDPLYYTDGLADRTDSVIKIGDINELKDPGWNYTTNALTKWNDPFIYNATSIRYLEIIMSSTKASKQLRTGTRPYLKPTTEEWIFTGNGTVFPSKYTTVILGDENFNSFKNAITLIKNKSSITSPSSCNNSVLQELHQTIVKHNILNPNLPGVAILNTLCTNSQPSSIINRFSELNLNAKPKINYAQYPKQKHDDGSSYQGQIINNKNNGYGRYIFKDGRSYEGQWKNGSYNGYGKYNDNNGQVYEGEFVDNHYQGYGKVITKEGKIYDGQWHNSKFEGQGKILYESKDVYDGEWKDDQHHGYGKYIWVNGDVYEGQWKNGQRYGQGRMTFKDGNVYDGQWENNNFHGQGKYMWHSGEIYEGQWLGSKRHGYGKNKYTTENIYDGQWVNNNRHGQGKFTWHSGEIYEGQWKDDKRFGYGINKYTNGNIYDGQWNDDKCHGSGKIIHPNGDIHEGQWNEGIQTGINKIILSNGKEAVITSSSSSLSSSSSSFSYSYSTYDKPVVNAKSQKYRKQVLSNGQIYEGEWLNGLFHGTGKIIYIDGNIYEGQWLNGKFNGQGKCIFVNGDVYEGQWDNDKKNGNGKFTWLNGEVYEGQWKDDKRSGHGMDRYTDGNIYEGQWLDNKFSGQGKYTFADGRVYEGQWADGKKNGQGKFTWVDKSIYEGQWINDIRQGKCKYTWLNGEVYEGQWLDNKRHGHGKNKYSNGNIYEGQWVNNKRDGQGKFIWIDKSMYNGQWINDNRSGYGEYKFINGDIYNGQWENDKRHGFGQMEYKDGRICDGTWVNDQVQDIPSVIETPKVSTFQPKSISETTKISISGQKTIPTATEMPKISISQVKNIPTVNVTPQISTSQHKSIPPKISIPVSTSNISSVSNFHSASKLPDKKAPDQSVTSSSMSVSQRIAAYSAMVAKK